MRYEVGRLGEHTFSLTEPLSLRRQPIEFEIHGHRYQLVRIRDHQLRKWIGNVLCIDEINYTHQFSRLEDWFRFDPWKSSFRFPEEVCQCLGKLFAVWQR